MKHVLAVLLGLLAVSSADAQERKVPKPAPASYAVRMTESTIKRFPHAHEEWDYVSGVILTAVQGVADASGNTTYSKYVRDNMDRLVNADGTIRTYELDEFNLDQVNQGKLLFRLYEQTRDERYRKAIELLREQLRQHPRTSEGGFWHKKVYPQQMWLDGLYMASPFLAQYAVTFRDTAALSDVTKQILLMHRHLRDPRTGLYYHAWDEARAQPWADSLTGLSKNFWGRSVGWFSMAIIDVLDYLPKTHRDYPAVVRVFNEMADAVADVQDPVTGLWYQVLDQPNRKGNYHEASASSMFVCSFAKGVRKGVLDARYLELARRGFDGIAQHMVSTDAQGLMSLNRINQVAGLGGKQQRSGTFEYYISEPVVSNDHKGVGPFIMAALELGR